MSNFVDRINEVPQHEVPQHEVPQRTPAVLGKIQKSAAAAVVVIGFICFYFYKREKYSLVSLGQALKAVSIGAALGVAAGVLCSDKNIPRNSS